MWRGICGGSGMKLTEITTPQARNYQCDKCKAIHCHKNMYNNEICYDCHDKFEKELIETIKEARTKP